MVLRTAVLFALQAWLVETPGQKATGTPSILTFLMSGKLTLGSSSSTCAWLTFRSRLVRDCKYSDKYQKIRCSSDESLVIHFTFLTSSSGKRRHADRGTSCKATGVIRLSDRFVFDTKLGATQCNFYNTDRGCLYSLNIYPYVSSQTFKSDAQIGRYSSSCILYLLCILPA
jgi:hypothetical protein